ncbi:MAG: GNAT family N-acetyltransferase [Capsulimonadaceae bacterium]
MQVSAVHDGQGLAALATEWRDLADACLYSTIFQTYEWNIAWWRHFGGGWKRLHVVVVRNDRNRLVGLAPLMTTPWYIPGMRRLAFVGTGGSDYLDFLAAPGLEEMVVDQVFTELGRGQDWQVADLQQLREGGLLRRFPPSGMYSYEALQEPCPMLPLTGAWEAVLAGLGKKSRYNIGYYGRTIEKLYEVEFGLAGEPQLADEMGNLFRLHQRRWNKRWLPGVFGTARVQRFHRDVASSLLSRGWLRLFTLRLDGNTEACLYCYSFKDRFCYYQGGFEPEFARLSPGTVLTARAIRTAIDEGKQVFDFLRGDEPYKSKWTGHSTRNARRLIARSLVTMPLVHAVQSIEDSIEAAVKRWALRMR